MHRRLPNQADVAHDLASEACVAMLEARARGARIEDPRNLLARILLIAMGKYLARLSNEAEPLDFEVSCVRKQSSLRLRPALPQSATGGKHMEENPRDEHIQEPRAHPVLAETAFIPYEASEEERSARWAELGPRMTFEEQAGGWIRMRIPPESEGKNQPKAEDSPRT